MAHTEYDADPQPTPGTGERLRVARIGKPHGIRGEVTVQLFTDDPTQRLAPGVALIREPGKETADRGTASLTVTAQRWNKQICLQRFEEINDRDAAEALRGSFLYIEAPAEPDEDEGWYSHDLEGMTCIDAAGAALGEVAELITGPAQDLLVVTTVDGEEVMVPFVEEIVPEIDVEARTIRLNPPAGLF